MGVCHAPRLARSLHKQTCQEEAGRPKWGGRAGAGHAPGIPHEPRGDAAYAAVHPADPAPRRNTCARGRLMPSSARADERAAACCNALVPPSGPHAGVRTKKAPADHLRQTERVPGRLTARKKGLTPSVIPSIIAN
jgi:hypothetical protein